MFPLTSREKWLVGIVLVSLLIGAAVHCYRHRTSEPAKGLQAVPVARPAKALR